LYGWPHDYANTRQKQEVGRHAESEDPSLKQKKNAAGGVRKQRSKGRTAFLKATGKKSGEGVARR